MTDSLLTPTEAAQMAGVSRQTIYLWIRRGLPTEYQGLRYRIRSSVLDQWMRSQRAQKAVA